MAEHRGASENWVGSLPLWRLCGHCPWPNTNRKGAAPVPPGVAPFFITGGSYARAPRCPDRPSIPVWIPRGATQRRPRFRRRARVLRCRHYRDQAYGPAEDARSQAQRCGAIQDRVPGGNLNRSAPCHVRESEEDHDHDDNNDPVANPQSEQSDRLRQHQIVHLTLLIVVVTRTRVRRRGWSALDAGGFRARKPQIEPRSARRHRRPRPISATAPWV
jgi:hypothetical protein